MRSFLLFLLRHFCHPFLLYDISRDCYVCSSDLCEVQL